MRWRIVSLFSLTAATILAGFSLLGYAGSYRRLEAAIASELKAEADLAVDETNAWFQERMIALDALGSYLSTPGTLEAMLLGGTDENPYLKTFIGSHGLDPYVGLPDHPPVSGRDFPEPPGYVASKRPWYAKALERGALSFSDYYIDSETKDLTTTLVVPIRGTGGGIEAVLATDLRLAVLLERLYSVDVAGGSVVMIDRAGKILAHADKKLINMNAADGAFKDPVSIMLRDRNGTAKFFEGSREKLMVFREIKATGWILGFWIDKGTTFAPLAAVGIQYAAFSLIAIAVFGLVSILIAGSITRRVRFVSDSLYGISQGEGDLTATVAHSGRDELGTLSDNFNRFVGKIRTLVAEIKESASDTSERALDLSSNTEEVGAAIEQINANLGSIEAQVGALYESLESNARSSALISDYVKDFDGRMDAQSSMVERTTSAIGQMNASISNVSELSQDKLRTARDLMAKTRDGGAMLEETIGSFKSGVVGRLHSIREITQLIKGISSRIDLLSMNAAIEAAHAGDAGRGFSVVADEIRKLAESSSSSVKSIEATIKEIDASANDTAAAADRTARSFEEINASVAGISIALSEIAESTSELLEGSGHIMESAAVLKGITAEVKGGSVNIRAQIQAMDRGVELAGSISDSVKGGIREAVAGSQEIVRSSSRISAIVGELQESARLSAAELGRFKT
ncbi:MAG: methyl-accepting chemotaxis protein [Spirochaetes bacterium]|nr:methyl-accepting chemotaxis protein [Spirochaetota bacterium]